MGRPNLPKPVHEVMKEWALSRSVSAVQPNNGRSSSYGSSSSPLSSSSATDSERTMMMPELIHPYHRCSVSAPLNLVARQGPVSSGHSRAFLSRRRELKMQEFPPVKKVQQIAVVPSRRSHVGPVSAAGVPVPPLDLTEENIEQVLADAKLELAQLFDSSVGITGQVELVEMDGPFVKISLRGRFWHERSMVLARVGNYLKQRIPEILEVDIEDEKMLDDSPENF